MKTNRITFKSIRKKALKNGEAFTELESSVLMFFVIFKKIEKLWKLVSEGIIVMPSGGGVGN